ncbi:MAG TPA: flagellar basal body protein [Polymorphobacter sp.]|nr:flagellar basal body protein [Polymorphobacter sp.]
MDLIDRQLGIHAQALTLRATRLQMIASNIANAATPGYKARDLDFRAAMDGASIGTATKYRVPAQTSLDGNTVELGTEQTQFAENAVDYRTTLSFLNGRIQTLMSALRGGE